MIQTILIPAFSLYSSGYSKLEIIIIDDEILQIQKNF